MSVGLRSHEIQDFQDEEDGPDDVFVSLRRDRYGFEIPSDVHEVRQRGFEEESRSAETWSKAMLRAEALGDELGRGRDASRVIRNRIKRLFRGGVPQVHRKWAWTHACGVAERLGDAGAVHFSSLWSRPVGSKEEETTQKQIEIDLHRTFPEHEYIASIQGQDAMRRVLVALSRELPEVGYCQSLNYVIAMLLVFLEGDENASFWIAVSLINQRLYSGTYHHDLIGLAVEIKAATALIKKKAPHIAKHMERCECDLSFFVTEWILTVFAKSLPSETVVRIWDTLMYEGSKVLHRIIVALLQSVEGDILGTDQAPDIAQIARRAARNFFDREKLLRAAFKKVGPFSHNILDEEREKALKQITAERRHRAAVRRGEV